MALIFGGPRASAGGASAVRGLARRPLVFGAELERVSSPSRASVVPVRRRREPRLELLRKGRCPYCGARLNVRVVGFRPVFFELESYSEDSIGLVEARDYEPDMIEAVCSLCGREFIVPRERKGVLVEEFEWLLPHTEWYRLRATRQV